MAKQMHYIQRSVVRTALHVLPLALILALLASSLVGISSVTAKEGAGQSWIASGSQPLPVGCNYMQVASELNGLFGEFNNGETLQLRSHAGLEHGRIEIDIAGPPEAAVLTNWDRIADYATERHAAHDRIVLLQTEVAQGDHPWLDITFDAFREADDFPGRVIGGRATFDCAAGAVLTMTIGTTELLPELAPLTIEVPGTSPPAGNCTVAPIAASTLSQDQRAVASARVMETSASGPSPVAGRGVAFDDPAVSGMLATLQELLACYNAHDFARAAALFTPGYFTLAPQAATELKDAAGIPTLLATIAGARNWGSVPLRPFVQSLDNPQLLDDGRGQAWITIGGDSTWVGYQQVVFAKKGNRWLIDGAYLDA